MNPELSILICALEERPWKRLYSTLLAQALNERHGRVEILVDLDDGTRTSGEKRNALVKKARGKYLAFVDDDDRVSPDYVRSIFAAAQANPDVVTFDIEKTTPDSTSRQSFGLKNADNHRSDDNLTLMTANHLCAWRAHIARQVAYCPMLGYGDDQLWYQPLVQAFPDLAEQHIHKVLYFYRWSPASTVNQKQHRREFARQWYAGGAICYKLYGDILVTTIGADHIQDTTLIPVRDRHNNIRMINRMSLIPYGSAKIQ